MGGVYGAGQGLFSAFSPDIALVTHTGITTVQEGWLDVYDQAPCIIKTLVDAFLQNFDANINNYLVMKVFTES